VRAFRERKGWSQSKLALKLQLNGWDTSRESVSSLENQQRRVPDLELFLIAKILGARMEELFPKGIRGKMRELFPQYRIKLARGQIPNRS
jgi:transcriptional regulator with XRE-family HTH domain